MQNLLSELLRPEVIVTLLFAFASFAAVLGVAAPLLQEDPLKERLKQVIKDKRLITPTGKFNAYNTRHDIY